MPDDKERRAAKRVAYFCEVECKGSGVRSVSTRISDLSTTGAFIDAMATFSPGTVLTVKFRVKDIDIEACCEVRYSMPQMGMGVHFLDLQPEQLAVLEHFVDGKPLPSGPLPSGPLPSGPLPAAPESHDGGTVLAASPERGPSSLTGSMLTGNFAVVSLFDVIHIIENNRLTGALKINSPAGCGAIFCNSGRIVDAETDVAVSVEALKRFLDTTEGAFEFTKSDSERRPRIQAEGNME